MEKLMEKAISTTFFLLLLIVGLAILPDYGISTDETVQIVHAEVQLDYAASLLEIEDWEPYHEDKPIETYGARHYSMLYGMFSTLIAEQLGYEAGNYRMAFTVRHYVIFLLFWLACITFYFTLKTRFQHWKYALFGSFLLILSPRIFANAFYNPKDMVVLVFYVYATASMLLFLRKRTWGTLLLHAIATAAVLNTRLPAIFVPVMTLFLLALDLLQSRKGLRKTILQTSVYTLLSFSLFVALFPYLWEDTLVRIVEVWQRMAKFNWGSSNLVFNLWIPGDETPAWYIPAWIVITTPLATLLLILVGVVGLFRRQLRRLYSAATLLLRQSTTSTSPPATPLFWANEKQLKDVAHLGLGIGPILAVIILGSNLYNGWRHLYFVYPSLIFLAVVAWHWLQQSKSWVRKIGTSIVVGNLIWIFVFMVWQHPHQQVYFNAVAGSSLTKRYDMDYWGLSFYTALQRLADETPTGEFTYVMGNDINVWYNALYLSPEQKAKIKYDWSDQHQGYYLSNFRRPKHHRRFFAEEPPHDDPYFIIDVMGQPIVGVFHKGPGGGPK